MIGFVFFFCLLFRWGILHRVLLVVGWCPVLYSSGFFCVSSHYLILPRVSSLVVSGHGVHAPTPKAQGLILSLAWVSVFFSACRVHSCPLSAGVLHALLCLKVYSWCICGERCTPHPATPLPPFSLSGGFVFILEQ